MPKSLNNVNVLSTLVPSHRYTKFLAKLKVTVLILNNEGVA